MFFELRQYLVRPGKKDEWVRMMEDEIIPFQQSQGMVIVGSFTGEEDASTYVWIRRFDSEAEREQLYAKVYESDHWKNDIAPKIPDLIDRAGMNIQRIEPTKISALR
ncbi:MAG: NIPSNAP family protein [Chloroflexi bacterium]|nr:NIPSNAP family protein [Chloroflexota bacterium]MDA1147391.1 NIPSNAP family protein [Chloroflexota bacterium]